MFTQAFLKAINFILGPLVEGAYSADPEDDGNWTGGEKGKGVLRGTKWGISAKAYPDLDIATLRRDDAVTIYWRDYWATIKGDQLPPRVAFVVLDAAVNQGSDTAVKLLQLSVGVTIDGVVGNVTVAACRGLDQSELVVEFLSRRAVRYAGTKNFARYGRGWFVRLFRAAQEA